MHEIKNTVVCQQNRKTCGTLVCYLQESQSHGFKLLIFLTIGPIFIQFTYFMTSIDMTLHSKLADKRQKQPSPLSISFKFDTLIYASRLQHSSKGLTGKAGNLTESSSTNINHMHRILIFVFSVLPAKANILIV